MQRSLGSGKWGCCLPNSACHSSAIISNNAPYSPPVLGTFALRFGGGNLFPHQLVDKLCGAGMRGFRFDAEPVGGKIIHHYFEQVASVVNAKPQICVFAVFFLMWDRHGNAFGNRCCAGKLGSRSVRFSVSTGKLFARRSPRIGCWQCYRASGCCG